MGTGGPTDPAGTFRRAYGLAGDTVLLIRPDGHLGHISNHDLPGTIRTEALVRVEYPRGLATATVVARLSARGRRGRCPPLPIVDA